MQPRNANSLFQVGIRIIIGASLLACICYAVAYKKHPPARTYRFTGNAITLEMPNEWQATLSPDQKTIVGSMEGRGGFYASNSFEPAGTRASDEFTKLHKKYFLSGNATSGVSSILNDGNVYYWFDYKDPAKRLSICTKGVIVFMDSKAVKVDTVRAIGDDTLGAKTMSVLASAREH